MTQVIEPQLATDFVAPFTTRRRNDQPAVLFGSRSDVIKLAPIVAALGGEADLLTNGWSEDVEPPHALLAEFGLRGCVSELSPGRTAGTGQLSSTVHALDQLFSYQRPGVLIVNGSSPTALAGALAAHDRGVNLINIGAGVRTEGSTRAHDHTQMMIDHRSNLLCASTAAEVHNLLAEGITEESIVCAGSTVVDAVRANLPDRTERRWIITEYGLLPDTYILASIVRSEHIGNFDTLATILAELHQLAERGHHIILPSHPRMIASVADAGLNHLLSRLHVLEPLAYRNYLALAAHASMIISDNPDTQLEVTILKRPLVAIGSNPAHRESIGSFARLVPPGERIGQTVQACMDNLPSVHRRLINSQSPYGTGDASEKIARSINGMLGRF